MLRTYEELKRIKSPSNEEFILLDRLQKIKSVIDRYGEESFYISFSGGKDSTVLSELIDLAIPENKIPRVYVNTGIEFNMIRDFVLEKSKSDSRIVIIIPKVPIKPMLEKDGYPFKSKEHSHNVERFNRIGMCPSIRSYLEGDWGARQRCPKKLRYQFEKGFSDKLLISDLCCVNMKEKPMQEWGTQNHRLISIDGIMKDEGGRRKNAGCLAFERGKLKKFHPLSVIKKDWEDWFIKEYDVKICSIYLSPYNLTRTGCKGCPFSLDLQHELDVLAKHFPRERKQCDFIWKPVYEECKR